MIRLFGVVLASLAFAAPASAFVVCTGPDVQVGAVPPPSITIASGDTIHWTVTGPHPATHILFPDDLCTVDFSASSAEGTWVTGCALFVPGTFMYSIEGLGAGSGTVTVLPPLLQVIPKTVVFGDDAVLSGQVPNQPECSDDDGNPLDPPIPEREASVLQRPAGASSFTPLSAVSAVGSRGDFALLVSPSIGTTYQARLNGITTETTEVLVRPRIVLTRRTRHRFAVRAAAAHSLAGARVQVQVRRGAGWRVLKSLRLGSAGTARFSLSRHGQVRVFMPAAEAGVGYVAGVSRSLDL